MEEGPPLPWFTSTAVSLWLSPPFLLHYITSWRPLRGLNTHWFMSTKPPVCTLKYQVFIHSPHMFLVLLLCIHRWSRRIGAVCSDGTAELVNNLLRHAALRRVTNACQRNGPREVRAGLLTSAPRQTERKALFDGRGLFSCLPFPINWHITDRITNLSQLHEYYHSLFSRFLQIFVDVLHC